MRLGTNVHQIFWAPDGASGANGGGSSDGNGGQNAGGNGGAQNAGRAGAGSSDDGEPAWLPKRLERAGKQAREGLLAELGIGPDEVGAFKETLTKQREGEGELVKFRRENESLKKDLAKRDETIAGFATEKRTRLVQDALRAAISTEASSGRRVIDAEALVLDLSDPRRPSYLGIVDDGLSVFENGNPVRGKDTAALLKAHLDGKPYLLHPVNPEGGAGTRQAAAAGGSSGKVLDLKTATFEEKKAALRSDPRYQAMVGSGQKKGK